MTLRRVSLIEMSLLLFGVSEAVLQFLSNATFTPSLAAHFKVTTYNENSM